MIKRAPAWLIKRLKPPAKGHSKYSSSNSVGPGPATYESAKQKDKLLKRPTVIYIGRKVPEENSERVTYTKQITLLKKSIPPVGHYEPNFDFLNKPYMRQRI